MDEGGIIGLLFERDQRALGIIDEEYGRYLLAVAEGICRDREDARECVNDTYYSVWNSIPPNRPSSLKRYLCAVCRNRAISKYRENGAAKRAGNTLSLDELGDVCAPADGGEIGDVINVFLKKAGKREVTVFVYRYYYNRTVKEIAEHLGLHDKTVYKILDKMKKELKKRLNEEGITV